VSQETRPVRYHWKSFFVNVLSPVILAIAMFNVLIFAIVIPEMRENIIEKKMEMLKELTRAELSEINRLHKQEQEGSLDGETARQMALARLKTIRYGEENKDYFWVSTREPRMIMHPYRPDLDGQDLTTYADPKGKRLFVEVARVVAEKGEGRVDYLWQWKDDEKKIVPKVSFVKWFEPWDWIIGTGVYIEDVRIEVDRMTRKVINISLGISFLVALLLLYMTRSSLAIEKQRSRAQAALKESEEKYRTLVESNTEGIMLAVEGRPVFCNRALLEMTGYSEPEFNHLTLEEIISPESELLKKSGETLEVITSQTPVTFGGKGGSLISFKDVSRNRTDPEALTNLLSELQASTVLSNASVGSASVRSVDCGVETSIHQASAIMAREGVGAILVKSPGGDAIGIVTDRDIRDRVVIPQRSTTETVAAVMTAPLITITESTLMFEAALIMQEKRVQHLVVTSEAGRTVGVLALSDVIQAQRHPASILLKNIQNAKSADDLLGIRDKVKGLISAMLENGAKVDSATRILSTITDATICRLVALAIEKMGSPPSSFAFIVLGSEARREQTLRTDQDNGIIYAATPGREADSFNYFVELGSFVSAELDRIGYQKCRGNVMASNPKWCRPIDEWMRYFSDCVNAQSPQDLLDFNVFFDFRHVYGDGALVERLRRHIFEISRDQHAFFFNLAESTLQFKPPIGFFGNLQLESSDEHPPAFNVKSAITPIVNFARIYALKHHIDECNTLERLARLQELGQLHKSSCEETVQGYSFLMRLRLVHQARMHLAGQTPDNFLELQGLSQLELSTIKKIFADIVILQAKLRTEFARTS